MRHNASFREMDGHFVDAGHGELVWIARWEYEDGVVEYHGSWGSGVGTYEVEYDTEAEVLSDLQNEVGKAYLDVVIMGSLGGGDHAG